MYLACRIQFVYKHTLFQRIKVREIISYPVTVQSVCVTRTSSGYILHADRWKSSLWCGYSRIRYQTTQGRREHLEQTDSLGQIHLFVISAVRGLQSSRVATSLNGAVNVRSSFLAVRRSIVCFIIFHFRVHIVDQGNHSL